ncbi:MAG: M16 family metallopeptidase, partial [Paracoccaceae bacterium]
QMRPDHVLVDVSFPHNHMDRVLEVVTSVLHDPVYDPKWVARMSGRLSQTMTHARAQPAVAMWEAGRRAALGADSPVYQFLSLPDVAQVAAVTPEDLKRWHARTVSVRPEAIAVVGHITQDAAGAAVDRLVGALPNTAQPMPLAQAVDTRPRSIYVHAPDSTVTSLGLMGILPATKDGADYIDAVAVRMLSEGTTAPLFTAVRTNLRATYGIAAGLDNYNRANRLFYMAGDVEGARLAEAVPVIRAAYTAFLMDPDADSLLALRDLQAEALESASRYVDIGATMMREMMLDGFAPEDAFALADKTRALSLETLRTRLHEDYPKADALIVLATGPTPEDLPGACVITTIAEVDGC